ncbi:hypothetical protein [Pseudomonas sp. Irchel s3b6]|uniref:hypothetical protein n=1 Tax=Pseudomonas sp. Irchel s3b6 TaxID=2009078 RepID=UPI002115941B|nr:hypothetical protein [Pseudomonas sp. Irchel s3b6]
MPFLWPADRSYVKVVAHFRRTNEFAEAGEHNVEVRRDLESVAPHISRLLNIGLEFYKHDKDWVHLKNEEDFKFIVRVPYNKRYKVEAVYATGRDMAMYMGGSLIEINTDFGRYPTLTSIVEHFKGSWVYGGYTPEIPEDAIKVCADHDVELWSVGRMVSLFKRQENLLAAVRSTLEMLKRSDLYREENGEVIVKQEANITLSGVSGSSININSAGATATVKTSYQQPAVFDELIAAVKAQGFDGTTEGALLKNVEELAVGHKEGRFRDAYKDFMQDVSAHITVFSPILAGLASLL